MQPDLISSYINPSSALFNVFLRKRPESSVSAACMDFKERATSKSEIWSWSVYLELYMAAHIKLSVCIKGKLTDNGLRCIHDFPL